LNIIFKEEMLIGPNQLQQLENSIHSTLSFLVNSIQFQSQMVLKMNSLDGL